MSRIQTLSIDLLRLDGDTQARIAIHPDTVDDYADLILTEGDWPFEPIDVFHDGSDFYVADGFHRTLAAIRLKRASIQCRVHNGTAKDAKIFGMTANDLHGLRMSREDKNACVIWLLDNGGKMTQAEIAKTAGVGERTVQRVVADRKPASNTTNPPMAGFTKPRGNSSKSDSSAAKQKAKEATAKAKSDAKAEKDKAKEKAKADSAAAREKAKAEKAAAKEKAKAVAKAAKEKAKEEAKAAKMAALPSDEQATLIRNNIQQHIDQAARLVCDLHRVKPNMPKRTLVVKLIQDAGLNLW